MRVRAAVSFLDLGPQVPSKSLASSESSESKMRCKDALVRDEKRLAGHRQASIANLPDGSCELGILHAHPNREQMIADIYLCSALSAAAFLAAPPLLAGGFLADYFARPRNHWVATPMTPMATPMTGVATPMTVRTWSSKACPCEPIDVASSASCCVLCLLPNKYPILRQPFILRGQFW